MPKKFPALTVIDLLARAHQQPLLPIRGRRREFNHIARLLLRRRHGNLIIVGRRGVGKTSLIDGFVRQVVKQHYPRLRSQPFLMVDVTGLTRLLGEAVDKEVAIGHIAAAWQSLPVCVVVLDDVEQLFEEVSAPGQFHRLFEAFLPSPSRHLLLVLEEEEWTEWQERYNRFLKFFDILSLQELSPRTCQSIIQERAGLVMATYGIQITNESLPAIYELSQKLSSTRAMPDRAIRFFDEVAAACQLQGKKVLTRSEVETIFTERQHLPARQLRNRQRARLQNLEQRLSEQIIGQPHILSLLTRVAQRGILGLKNPQRPLGSFLFLGPSGVGKTEVARVLAREIYGQAKAFIRLDMSEYSEAHTMQRLVGAPPGYIGHEEGGQLTRAVAEQPFSLILLDEIEKAHPTVFDMFLQILEDGRLTDGRGQTVDFCNTIIMATSNLGVERIIAAWRAGEDVTISSWLQQYLMPVLTQRFRLEFLNRFEVVGVFQPLSIEHLVAVARLEIVKLERRLRHHRVRLAVSDEQLSQVVSLFADPRFGARPIKRFIEQIGEQRLTEHLLRQTV